MEVRESLCRYKGFYDVVGTFFSGGAMDSTGDSSSPKLVPRCACILTLVFARGFISSFVLSSFQIMLSLQGCFSISSLNKKTS